MRFLLSLGLMSLAVVNAFPAWHDGFDEKAPLRILYDSMVRRPQDDIVHDHAFLSRPLYCFYPADQLPKPKPEYEKGANYLETAFNFVTAVYPQGKFRQIPDYYVGANSVAHVQFLQLQEGEKISDSRITVSIGPKGDVSAWGGNFEDQRHAPSSLQNRYEMDPLGALKAVSKALAIPIDLKYAKPEARPWFGYKELNGRTIPKAYTFTGIEGVLAEPRAEFCLHHGHNGKLMYAWEIRIKTPDLDYLAYIDAATNTQVLATHDLRRQDCASSWPSTLKTRDTEYASSIMRDGADRDPLEALKGVVKALSLPFDVKHAKTKHVPVSEGKSGSEPEESVCHRRFDCWTFTDIKGESIPEVTAQFGYVNTKEGLVPAWEFRTRFGSHHYLTYIEANTNTHILESKDLTISGCFRQKSRDSAQGKDTSFYW
ncbi:hypothetical protein B0J13DRAFT_671642 [Dactylonectria estremocensis]|uniref:Uncharacterized protein n=1 Tax=Dactylonectria estremocensis TaxID=1079267 RepID=A0A9P9FDD6_9HYPO|nr:hypothetical protein B0J13DRAFT_671642 [Dactylonectria estremocensis]